MANTLYPAKKYTKEKTYLMRTLYNAPAPRTWTLVDGDWAEYGVALRGGGLRELQVAELLELHRHLVEAGEGQPAHEFVVRVGAL